MRSTDGRAGNPTEAFWNPISCIHQNRPGHRNRDIHLPPGVPPPVPLKCLPLQLSNVKRIPPAAYRAAAKTMIMHLSRQEMI